MLAWIDHHPEQPVSLAKTVQFCMLKFSTDSQVNLFECKQLAGLFAKCLVSVCLKHLKVLWTERLHFDNVLCTQRLHLAFTVWIPIYLRHFITEVSVSKTASSFYGMVTNLFITEVSVMTYVA